MTPRTPSHGANAISPLAPATFPDLPVIDGVRFATGAAGVKYKNRTDVMLAHITGGSTLAGVFTKSATRSTAVLDCQAKLAALPPKPQAGFAIVVNSGNANTFTGRPGENAVSDISVAVAKALQVPVGHVFTASTGVIGEPLPTAKITAALPGMAQAMAPHGISGAARAIMTTDTFPKGAAKTIIIGDVPVTIVGIAKGSGMIAPNMATMLSFIFTDADVAAGALQKMLTTANALTFNAVTVDGDTSTSDTVLIAATGTAGNTPILSRRGKDGKAFAQALEAVMHDLAIQIARDGEGATKLVEVRVTGAKSPRDADRVARSIANSPLVKTAIAGADPNWGRVVMAVGKSGAAADRDRLTIRFGDILVAENGWAAQTYQEAAAAAYMQGAEVAITVDLGLGHGAAKVWTCDLTHGYIDINTDYRS